MADHIVDPNKMVAEQACDLLADFEDAKSTIAAYRQAVACLVEGGSPDGVTPEVAARHIREIVDAYDAARAELAAMRAAIKPFATEGKEWPPTLADDTQIVLGLPGGRTDLAAFTVGDLRRAAAPQPPVPEPRGATRILPQEEIDVLFGFTDTNPEADWIDARPESAVKAEALREAAAIFRQMADDFISADGVSGQDDQFKAGYKFGNRSSAASLSSRASILEDEADRLEKEGAS